MPQLKTWIKLQGLTSDKPTYARLARPGYSDEKLDLIYSSVSTRNIEA